MVANAHCYRHLPNRGIFLPFGPLRLPNNSVVRRREMISARRDDAETGNEVRGSRDAGGLQEDEELKKRNWKMRN